MKRKAPTMADVAKRAGVSTMTVSRALRSGTAISDDTRKKIVAAAEELGYVIDATASGFASGKTGFVAMTIPSIDNANFAATVRGVTEELRGSGMQLLLGCTNYDVAEEERLVEGVLGHRPDAVIVTGGSHTDRCRRLLASYDAPIIETWDLPATPLQHVVGFSNHEAGRRMADHLYDEGYRRIAFIGGDRERDTRGADRRRGFEARLIERDLSVERVISAAKPPIMMQEAARVFDNLITRWPDTDAVMCVSDLAAFGALSAALQRGLRVPDDIAIAGFGAYDISAFSNPQLTTIDVKAHAIGRQAALLLRESLGASEKDQTQQIRRTAVDIVVRRSTRRCAGEAPAI